MKVFRRIITFLGVVGALLFLTAVAQVISPFDLVNLKNQGLGDISAYEKIKIIDAWNFIEQAEPSLLPVNVGIFDTGIDIFHPEFAGVRVAATITEDSVGGGHGTQVAGIIGANNLSFGGQYTPPQMNGVLSGVRDLNYTLQIRSSETFTAFATSTDNMRHFTVLDQLARLPGGIQVINGSFGEPLCDALSRARRAIRSLLGLSCYDDLISFNDDKDIYTDLVNQYPSTAFILAAGNDGINAGLNLPGGGVVAPNVIAVGATDLNDNRATFSTILFNESNFGPTVNISAPGVKIYTPKPLSLLGSDYGTDFSGTSASAPMVTGVAAILKALDSSLTPAQIKNILIGTADPIRTGEPTKRLGRGCYTNPNDPVSTGCRLNALRAVQAVFGIRYIDDFENLALGPLKGQGNWIFSPAAAPNFVVQDEVASEGRQAVKGWCIAPCPTNQVVGKDVPSPPDTAVPIGPITDTSRFTTISFDMRVDSGFALVHPTDRFFRDVFLIFRHVATGNILLSGGVGAPPEVLISNARLGAWYRFDVHVDLENQRVQARVDGGPWSDYVDFPIPIESVNHFHLRVGSGPPPTQVDSTAYYDNIYVTAQQ